MKIEKLIMVQALILISGFLHAQEIIATGGDYFTTVNGSLSFTIGEPVIETFSSQANVMTNGFQQSKLSVTGIDNFDKYDFKITATPNPADEIITIQVQNAGNEHFNFRLYDPQGKLILKNGFEAPGTEILFGQNAPGLYILKIFINNDEIQGFKIIKQ